MVVDTSLYIDTAVYTGELRIPATSMINYLPGAKFNYDAANQSSFQPWGFEGADVQVDGLPLNSSQLFAVTLQQLGLSQELEGTYQLNATSQLQFHYQTSSVVIDGSSGSIDDASGVTSVSTDGAVDDSLTLVARATGSLSVTGTLEFLPTVEITSVGGVPQSLMLPYSVGLQIPVSLDSIPVTYSPQFTVAALPCVN
jgi:hypothetical protein